MAEYADKNSEKFIPDKDAKKAILLNLSRLDKINPVKKRIQKDSRKLRRF